MFINFRTHFYFLEGLSLLFFTSVLLFFLLLIFELPIVEDPADWRFRHRSNFDQVQVFRKGQVKGFSNRRYSQFGSILINEKYFLYSNFLINTGLISGLLCYGISPPYEIGVGKYTDPLKEYRFQCYF